VSAVLVNGRFLGSTPTGLHRLASSLLDAAVEGGLDVEIARPPSWATRSPVTAHAWEQGALPLRAGNRLLLSLTNTAPIWARHGAVMVADLAPLVGPHWFRHSMQLYSRIALAAASRVHVVRPAVGAEFAPAGATDIAAVRERLGLTKPFLLAVGWADPRKDTATAVAAHLIARATVDHDLVLAGHPHPNFAPVPVPDEPSVRLAGYVSDVELRALLTGAAALVYPSRYEGFGLPPLEAWACGTPAIVGDTPSVREATEGRARYLSPGDVTDLARAMVEALSGSLAVPAMPAWTWADAAGALRTALP
jgi:glycosyltransferase involved in cell wall biosynthesis